MALPTEGNLLFAQPWGVRPLREYDRSGPDPATPVQTLIADIVAAGLSPAFVSQLTNGNVIACGQTIGNDIVQVDASGTETVYFAWDDLIALVPDLEDAWGIMNAQVDATDRLVLVYDAQGTYKVARFNADQTLDVDEVYGYTGNGPYYAAISRDGTKLAYVRYAASGSNRNVHFCTWTIDGSETVLRTELDDSGTNDYSAQDVHTDLADPAFGFAANGDPLFLYTSRIPAPVLLVIGNSIDPGGPSQNTVKTGVTHDWTYTDAQNYTYSDSWPSAANLHSLPPSTTVTIPEDGEYKVEYFCPAVPTSQPSGTIYGTGHFRIYRNGDVLASLTRNGSGGPTAWGISTLVQWTGTLEAGDTISTDIENVDASWVATTNPTLTIGRILGWEYPVKLERFGASPGVWDVATSRGEDVNIFAGVGGRNAQNQGLAGSGKAPNNDSPDWYQPYLVGDSFSGPQTAWGWRGAYNASPPHDYLVQVSLPGGSVTLHTFEDPSSPGSAVGSPLWIVPGASVEPVYPGVANYDAAVVLRGERRSF